MLNTGLAEGPLAPTWLACGSLLNPKNSKIPALYRHFAISQRQGYPRLSFGPGADMEEVVELVQYEQGGGKTEGYTRMNESRGVPGGNGTWNLDMHGRLTREFLIITRLQHADMGPEIIPVSRLVNVWFGDGGIKVVNEGKPNPAK